MQQVQLILISVLLLSPVSSFCQGGVGGSNVHPPQLGCACLPTPENESKAAQKSSSHQLSEEECKRNRDVAIVYGGSQVDKKAVILDRPKPELSNDLSGTPTRVILKIVLCPKGFVGRVGVVVGASASINERAIEAARKIRFEPALKNGSAVAQYYQVEYAFDAPQ